MAQCKYCGRGGFLQAVNKLGLCDRCALPVQLEIEGRMRVVQESLKFINESKSLKTRLSRCGVLIDNLKELIEFERKGIPFQSSRDFGAVISEVQAARVALVLEEADSLIERAQLKSDSAATAASKASPFQTLLPKLHELQVELTDPAPLKEKIRSIEFKINRMHVGSMTEKARKFEFKEDWKKALDQYQEALFFVKNDSIDDFLQSGIVHELESKIAELKAKLKSGA